MPTLKGMVQDDLITIASHLYPDNSIVPYNDIPDIWRNQVLDFGCQNCGSHFASQLMRLFVNMDYFEPESQCPVCSEWTWVKNWR